MTLEKIKSTLAADMSTEQWLRELCIQIATMNAKQPKKATNDSK